MSTALPHARPPVRPKSPLHAVLEQQARQIDRLQRQLAQTLADFGIERPVLRPPPLDDLRPEGYRPLPDPGAPPAAPSWWPREPLLKAPLEPQAGRRATSLAGTGLPVVAVSVCGLPREAMARVATEVADKQARERAFLPLFLVDSPADLDLFRANGHTVELLPSTASMHRCPGTSDPDAYLRRRLERLQAQWGIRHVSDLGSRPLAHLLPDAAGVDSTPALRLVFWKDYRRYNPYQYLLYASLPGIAAEPGDIASARAALTARRPGDPDVVFHLNWEEAVYRPATTPTEARGLVAGFLADLDAFLAEGGRLLWTVHNLEPHENDFPAVHRHFARAIGRRAHLVHVHSHTLARLVGQRCKVPPKRLILAPHGDYRGVFQPYEDRSGARRALGIPAARTSFGLVGTIRPYKGAADLVAAFARLGGDRAVLVLAGRQEPPLDLDALPAPVREALVCRDAFIPDGELPRIVAACDFLVLPYRNLATSGSIMLAFSLATPVIVPDLPTIREVVRDGENGLLYASQDPDGLAAALERATQLPARRRAAMRAAAGTTASRFGWDWIGRRLAARLRGLEPP